MKYIETNFTINPYNEDFSDILSGMLAEIGYETFLPSSDGLTGYIQQTLFSEENLKDIITNYPIPDIGVKYSFQDAPDENWNKTWEEEGFKPIIIGNEIAVHSSMHKDIPEVKYDILIHPQLAFGTGSHQTTRLILATLKDMDLKDQFVIDAGTGTGILSIMALKRKAGKVLAYDIDEWSVNNAKENLLLNGTASKAEVVHGASEILTDIKNADLLIANINRNILLNDMPTFAKTLKQKAKMILSGFYKDDIAVIEKGAKDYGLYLKETRSENEWAMLLFETNAARRMNT